MCGGTGEDFEVSPGLMPGKCSQRIPVQLAPKHFAVAVKIFVISGEHPELRLQQVSLSFQSREFDPVMKIPFKSSGQQWVGQHRAKRGCQGHRQSPWQGVIRPSLHSVKQWQVAFCQRLKQPVFFVERFVFGMPNEWQMGMEDDCQEMVHGGIGAVSKAESKTQAATLGSRNEQIDRIFVLETDEIPGGLC
jgi:hypothetical protein